MENRTEIFTGDLMPLVLNEATGKREFPQPHNTYIHSVHHYMMERTLGMDCLLYVDYLESQKMFRVNMAKSVNISDTFRNEVELEMDAIMGRLLSK